MLIYKKDTPYFTITLDLEKNQLNILQRWRYSWTNDLGTSKWTYAETKDFHYKVDRLIWSVWGSRFNLKLTPGSKIPANYRTGTIKTFFDVKWVLDNTSHWVVNVSKIKANSFKRSSVNWDRRAINLDTEDMRKVLKYHNGPLRYEQYGVAHEFGHTIGNVTHVPNGHGDEYLKESTYQNDFPSIMNSGTDLRQRHFDFIKQCINSMVPGMRFEITYVH